MLELSALHSPALCRLALAPALQLLKSSDIQLMGHKTTACPYLSFFLSRPVSKRYMQANDILKSTTALGRGHVLHKGGMVKSWWGKARGPSDKHALLEAVLQLPYQEWLNATVVPQHPWISVLLLHAKLRKLTAHFHYITGITTWKPFSHLTTEEQGWG